MIEPQPKVEKIPPLLALVKGAQLGAKQLVELVSRDLGFAREPGTGYGERLVGKADRREVFAGVDLDLRSHADHRREARVEAIVEREATVAGFPFGRTQPRVEYGAQFVDERPDGASVALHEVDVFGVSPRRVEEELVQCGSPAEGDLRRDGRVTVEFDQRARKNEVLFDVAVVGPGGCFRQAVM